MASPPSKTGHGCLTFVVTVMFMLGFSGHVTSDCDHPGTGFWLVPADDVILSFESDSVSGHIAFDYYGNRPDEFTECKTTSNGNNIYVARDQETGDFILADLYICWKLVQQSSSVMLLYELAATDPWEFGGQKLKNVNAGSPAPADSAVCSLNAADFHPKLLYKVDSDAVTDISVASLNASKTACPDFVLEKYSYVMGTDCQGMDNLDVCQDTGAARVCPDKPILFSNDGLLSCLATYTASGTTYVLMGNHDATVSSPETSRFVCIKAAEPVKEQEEERIRYQMKSSSEWPSASLLLPRSSASSSSSSSRRRPACCASKARQLSRLRKWFCAHHL